MTLRAELIDLGSIPEFTLRPGDLMECLAAGMTPELAVRRSVAGSQMAYAHYVDDELVCLWGYRWANHSEKTATMWLLSTEAADRHRIAFGRATQKFLKVLLTEISEITILVHNQYHDSIKWLEWLGFKRARAITANFTEMKRERV